MGRKRLSMSEKIRRYLQAHPNVKPQDVVKALDVKSALVYAVKQSMKNRSGAFTAPVVTVDKPSSSPKYNQEAWRMLVRDRSRRGAPAIQMIEPKPDVVNNPPHYTDGGIEVIDFLQAKLTPEEFIGYLKGNALKYGARMGKKDSPATDAGKMAWYASKLRDTLTAV